MDCIVYSLFPLGELVVLLMVYLLSFCYGCHCSDRASAGVYLGSGIGRVWWLWRWLIRQSVSQSVSQSDKAPIPLYGSL